MHPEEIHLTVAIVRYRTQGKLKTPVFMILISNDYSIENKYKMATVHSCKNYIFVYSLHSYRRKRSRTLWCRIKLDEQIGIR